MEGSGGYEDLENRKIAPPDDARQLLGFACLFWRRGVGL